MRPVRFDRKRSVRTPARAGRARRRVLSWQRAWTIRFAGADSRRYWRSWARRDGRGGRSRPRGRHDQPGDPLVGNSFDSSQLSLSFVAATSDVNVLVLGQSVIGTFDAVGAAALNRLSGGTLTSAGGIDTLTISVFAQSLINTYEA